MGKYVERNLLEGEKIVCEAQIHWCYWVRPFISVLFFVILGSVLAFGALNASGAQCTENAGALLETDGAVRNPDDYSGVFKVCSIVCFVIAVFIFIRRYIKYKTTEMVITTRRLVYKRGFISRHTFELQLSKVETIQVDQTVLGRVFNYGKVSAIGTGGTGETISFIARPMNFRNEFQKCVDLFAGTVSAEAGNR